MRSFFGIMTTCKIADDVKLECNSIITVVSHAHHEKATKHACGGE